MRLEDTTLFADLTLRYIGLYRSLDVMTATVKGDVPGHEFHGNQYGEGQGGGDSGGASSESGGSAGNAMGKSPKVKLLKGYDLHDQFMTKRGNAAYSIQKPSGGQEKGWRLVKHMIGNNRSMRSTYGKPVHFVEMQDKKQEVINEFNTRRRQEG